MGEAGTLRWVGRALVAVTALVWLACGTDGDVAMSMMCPTGETCGETLTGARFTGSSPSDRVSQRLPTAVGGRQRVGVAAPLLSGVSLPEWHAVSSESSVFVVEAESRSSVTLRGVGPGSAYLRLLDEDDNLVDRIRFGAAEIASAQLVSSLGSILIPAWEGSFVFMHGSESVVVAALLDADGGRVVDEDAAFVAGEGVVPRGWDAATVSFPSSGDTFDLTVGTGAGERFVMRAALVDAIDQIRLYERVAGEADAPITFSAGRSGSACFITTLGEAAVVGAVLSIESVDGIVAELSTAGALTCVSFTSEVAGDYALRLIGPGAQTTVEVTVTEARP